MKIARDLPALHLTYAIERLRSEAFTMWRMWRKRAFAGGGRSFSGGGHRSRFAVARRPAVWLACMLALLQCCLPLANAIADEPPTSLPAPAARLTDAALGAALTDWLHAHRLPVVGASVSSAAGGQREVILFGYTATPFGRRDAEDKTRRLLGAPGFAIANHIQVRPQLRTAHEPAPRSVRPVASESTRDNVQPDSMPGVREYEAEQGQDRSLQEPTMNGWMPLLIAGAVLGVSLIAAANSNSGY
jgi:hypothetical protein